MNIAIPRTVPAPVSRRRSSKRTQQPRDEGLFWVARQILRSNTDAERAAILLQLPDLLIAQKTDVLREACEACGFDDGIGYIAVRAATSSATRDEYGQLPADKLDQLERWRCGMAALAHQIGGSV